MKPASTAPSIPSQHPSSRPHFALNAATLAIAGVITGLQPQWSWAQEAAPTEATLSTVNVIASTPLPGAGVALKQFAGAVQAVTGDQLESSLATDLTEYMQHHMGSVTLNHIQGNSHQPDVNYRGYTASPLLGTAQGLSVYWDGVRMNQPFGDVMSWDLIPRAAIDSVVLMPGSNPLFGLNTLGGALSLQSKSGLTSPGTTLQTTVGSHGQRAVELTHGGSNVALGRDWFLAANIARDKGWRVDSPSNLNQLFGKLGWAEGSTRANISLAHAHNTLNGNGLQEERFLAKDWRSVYTRPDITRNRSTLLNLSVEHEMAQGSTFSGNAYLRHMRSSTYNADINEGSLDQSVYQPSAADLAALKNAGYTGYPTSGATAANTPFPFWRCIAQALQNDEPGEKCNGLINQTRTSQHNAGLAGQWTWKHALAGNPSQTVVGAGYDASRVGFGQTTQLGYLNPDRTVTGVNAWADGVTGGNVDGEPYDARVDLSGTTRVSSVFAANTTTLGAFHLTTSGRFNHATIRNTDRIHADGDPSSLSGNHRYQRFNPAVGVTYAPHAGLTAYAGYNEGSRAPSTIELGCANPEVPCKLPNSMAGDPPLKQVVTRTFDVGVRGKLSNGWLWNAGAFRSDASDDILFVAADQTGYGYFKNVGSTRRQGLELGLRGKVDRFSFGGNFSVLDATFQSTEVLNGSANSSNASAQAGRPGTDGSIRVNPGDRIPLLPRFVLKLDGRYKVSPQFTLGAGIVSQAGMLARGNENNQHAADGVYYLGSGKTAGYTVLNLNATYAPAKHLELFFKIDNVLNKQYSTAAQLGATGFDANGNFVARPLPRNGTDYPVRSATFYAPGAPRSFLLGLRYRFD